MPASTQQFLEIDQIREGVIVLRNGALRGVFVVAPLNFALKSEEEQDATIYQFQNFLNSLDFSIQIVVQSRKLNFTGYIDKLKELEAKQKNELLRVQTASYREFVESLIQGAGPAGRWGEIMSKSFFVVVPFTLMEAQLQARPTFKEMFKEMKAIGGLTEEQFQRCRQQLWQRMEFVALGLRRCGLQCIPLDTMELIEFFWSTHHPKEAEIGYHPELPPELMI